MIKFTNGMLLQFDLECKNISSFQVLRLRENCEENRMLCERFLSDYREIFEAKAEKISR